MCVFVCKRAMARMSGVLVDSVEADSPANGRPVFRGELSFEQVERSDALYRGIGGELNFPHPVYTDYLNLWGRENWMCMCIRLETSIIADTVKIERERERESH